MTKKRPDRREFFRISGQAALGCACLGTLSGCLTYTFNELSGNVTINRADYPALAEAGGVASVPRSASGFKHPIFVRNEGDEVFLAMSGECAHEGCSVRAEGEGFRCGCHGARFSATGGLESGPASEGLLVFVVEVTPETITIKNK